MNSKIYNNTKSAFKKLLTASLCLIVASLALASFTACNLFGSWFNTAQHSFPNLISESEAENNPVRPLLASNAQVLGFRGHDNSVAALHYQLWEVLEMVAVQQARPDLNCPNIFSEVRDSFNGAVAVLNRYIRNDFTQTQRLLAIHDFLSYRVYYDYDLFERYLQGELSEAQINASHSFDIRGIFLNPQDRVAVCEGIARGFMLMAGIEGIYARTVTGSFSDGTRPFPIRHMWNIVRIGNRWYHIDVTLNNRTFNITTATGVNSVRVLNHGFFLRSDAAMNTFGGHIQDSNAHQRWPVPAAVADYNFFSGRYFCWDSSIAMRAYTEAQLVDIFRAVRNQNGRVGAVQVQLAFTNNIETTNDLNIFGVAIERAYAAIPNANFSFRVGQTTAPPFAQYPGGVFVFMIYS